MQDNRESLLQSQSSSKDETILTKYNLAKKENEKLLFENESLKKNLEREELCHRNLYKQWNELNARILEKDRELEHLKTTQNPKLKVYQYAFYGLLLIIVLFAVINYYSFTKKGDENSGVVKTSTSEKDDITSQTVSYATKRQNSDSTNIIHSKKNAGHSVQPEKTSIGKNIPAKYLVKVKTYFHNEADINTRRNTFLLPGNDAYSIITALDDKNGFIYVVFINHKGRTSKGWISKSDLEPLN